MVVTQVPPYGAGVSRYIKPKHSRTTAEVVQRSFLEMDTRRKGVVGSPPTSPFSARRKRRQSTDMGLLHGDPLSPLENSDLSDLLLKMRKEHTSAPQKDLRSRHKYNFIFRLLFM